MLVFSPSPFAHQHCSFGKACDAHNGAQLLSFLLESAMHPPKGSVRIFLPASTFSVDLFYFLTPPTCSPVKCLGACLLFTAPGPPSFWRPSASCPLAGQGLPLNLLLGWKGHPSRGSFHLRMLPLTAQVLSLPCCEALGQITVCQVSYFLREQNRLNQVLELLGFWFGGTTSLSNRKRRILAGNPSHQLD